MDITNAAPNNIFDTIKLEYDFTGNVTFVKTLYKSFDTVGGYGVDLIGELTNNNSTLNLKPYDLSSIYVEDSIFITQGSGTLTGFTQTITQFEKPPVPGPLPLLGAGAAFGFSRRLRRRTLQARFLR